MTGERPARNLPNGWFYIVLAAMFLTTRILALVLSPLPVALQLALGAAWGWGLAWGIAAAFLRSDPRVWLPHTAWYRTNLRPLEPAERDATAALAQSNLATDLRLQLAITAALGASALGILRDLPTTLSVVAALITFPVALWIGTLTGLKGASDTRTGAPPAAGPRAIGPADSSPFPDKSAPEQD